MPPLSAAEQYAALRLRMAKAIIDFEARRDKAGHLVVYKLPPNDGGGEYEVAGINQKYDREVCDKLVALINAGKFDEAERTAQEYIAKNTDGAADLTRIPSVEFVLRDCWFNRGPKGAKRILQRALDVTDDGDIGPITKKAMAEAEEQPQALLQDLRAAREDYERDVVGYRSNFWKGLVNRWDHALSVAMTFPDNPVAATPAPDSPEAAKPPPAAAASTKVAWPHEAQAGALDAFYGNPRGSGDKASSAWSAANLVKVVPPWKMTYEGAPVAAITIHKKCAESLTRILNAIWEHYGKDQAQINAVHLNEFDGSFNYRTNRNNPNKLSVHSYGAALDIAASKNANGKAWKRGAGMMPIAVVKIFAAEGWAWGGQFGGTKDAMHFQATFNPHAGEALPSE